MGQEPKALPDKTPDKDQRTGTSPEFYRLRRRLSIAAGALISVTAVGTIGYVVIGAGEHGIVDAIYMTVITLTTVGFGEIIDMTNNPTGRIFTVLLLLIGMGIVAYSIPLMAAFVIEGQLSHTFLRRRMLKRVAQMINHHVVCGDTPTAAHVASELVRTGRDVVLAGVAEGSTILNHCDLSGLPNVYGDPSDDSVLTSAKVQSATGLVACMESDKDNVLVVLTARRLARGLRIVAAAEGRDVEPKLRAAGADAVVCASQIGGLRMASELVRPKVVSFLDQMLRDKRSSLRVEEVSVPYISSGAVPLSSGKIDEVAGAVLLAVQRTGSDEFEFDPPPNTPLESGMVLIVMADAEGRAKIEQELGRLV
jgi:voltage-gated potassium channel